METGFPNRAIPSEDREVAQQRDDADDDNDHAHDLPGAAVDRQHVDEIEHENDDDKSDQRADKERHEIPRDEMSPPLTECDPTPISPFCSGPDRTMKLAKAVRCGGRHEKRR